MNGQMLERGRIDSKLATMFMVGAILPTAILTVPAAMLKLAKQDAWLCVLIASCTGLVIGLLTVSLVSRFPGQTIVQCAETILGKLLGKVLGFLYVWWFFHSGAAIVCEFGAFLSTAILPETPTTALLIAGVVATVYAVYCGLEVLTRFGQLCLPPTLTLLLAVMALLCKDMKLTRMLPVFDTGILPVLKGSIPSSSWMGEQVLLGMIAPYLTQPQHARQVVFWSVITTGFFFMASLLAALLTYGPHVAGTWIFPTYNAVRLVSLANFLERLESVVVALWVLGGIVKLGAFYYCAVLASAQWLGLKDYRPLVLPSGAILIALACGFCDNVSQLARFTTMVWPFYALPIFELGIPLFLLLVTMIKGKRGAPHHE